MPQNQGSRPNVAGPGNRPVRTPSMTDDEGEKATCSMSLDGKGKQSQCAAKPQAARPALIPDRPPPPVPAVRPVLVPSEPRTARPVLIPDRPPPPVPAVRPVIPPSVPQARPLQPGKKVTVGHPDRMTQWADFSQFVPPPSPSPPSPPEAKAVAAEKQTLANFDKPLPEIPSPTSHLRVTKYFGQTAEETDLMRKRSHRLTSVYAGQMIAPLPEEDASPPGSSIHTTFERPNSSPKPENDADFAHRFDFEAETPPGSGSPTPRPLSNADKDADSTCRHSFDFGFDDDDGTPVVDTFIHPGHTSFLVTQRLEDNTVHSARSTQERLDRDVVQPQLEESPDLTQDLWNSLRGQAGGSWGADS